MRHPPTPGCDCDFCFVHDVEAVVTSFREIRQRSKSPLSDLPGWDHAEQLAAEADNLCDEYARGVA